MSKVSEKTDNYFRIHRRNTTVALRDMGAKGHDMEASMAAYKEWDEGQKKTKSQIEETAKEYAGRADKLKAAIKKFKGMAEGYAKEGDLPLNWQK